MAATLLASNSKTILDLTDGGVLTAYLTCNQPKVQVYDANTNVYSPNWTSSNVVITPSVFLDQTSIALTSDKLTLTWKRREGNGSEAGLRTGETVSSGILTVNQNKLSSITSGILTYVLTVRYQDASTGLDLTVKSDITFTLTKTGSNSKLISITGDQVFKIDKSGNVSPSSIVLTAYAQNVTISKWQYKNSSGNWVDYGNNTGATLTVLPTDNIWTNNVANIKVISSDANVYDTTSLYKVADGTTISSIKYQQGDSATTAPTGTWSNSPVTVEEGKYLWTKTTYTDNSVSYSIAKQGVTGDDASVVFLSNENITFSGNKSGKVAATTKTCNIVAYTGTTKVTPTVGDITGAPTGMTVTKGAASNNEIPISIAITANSTLGGSGERSGTLSIPITSPVATTLQIRWNKVNTGATGAAGANVATLYLYKRATSTPSKPASALTYTFSTKTLSGELDGWMTTVPSGLSPCYITIATASSNTDTDTIESSEWSSPVMLVQNGADGTSAYILSVYAPAGTVFNNGVINGTTSLTLVAQFYQGATDLTDNSSSYYLWEKYVNGNWTTAQAEAAGSNGKTLTVQASEITISMNYRCRAKYGSSSTAYFYDTVTIVNRVDNYQAGIESTSGDIFQNGVGDSTLYCRVWQAGIEVDELKKAGNDYVFSATAPSDPENGWCYYQIQNNTPETQLKKYNGASWVNASHLLTYTWYRRDTNGNLMDDGEAFATGKVIHVTGDDVEGKTTFICEVGTIAIAQFSIRDDSDIIIQDGPPANPAINTLWLQTSVSPNVLKKYNGEDWQIINDTSDIYNTITNSIETASSSILSTVDTKIADARMTDADFTVMFGNTVGPGIMSDIGDVQTNLETYQRGIANYMRYDDTGTLTLGKTNNNFQTQLTNTKMAFMEGNSEVAYISNQSLFITTARVTDTLSLGTNNGNGYFDWVVTATGLGLKWRNPGYGGIKVTMRFIGLQSVPANFQITNNYNSSVFTAANKEAGDGINTPFEWTISGLAERTSIVFTQSGVDVSGYTKTGSPANIVSDTVLTDIIITVPFTNEYTRTT